MDVRAVAKFIRVSPRKARLVVDVVRGKSVVEAERLLMFMNKKAAAPVLKLIRSAAANAEHNFKLNKDQLVVAEIQANVGFVMKRFMPRAFGRAATLRKRTSHLSVVLRERPKQPNAEPTKKEATK